MKTSQSGLDFIADHEGLELVAYPDPGSGGEPWTIGVGHTGGVKPGDTCTKHEALQWLAEDVETAERAVLRMVDVPLSQNQFDALLSFLYNVGSIKSNSGLDKALREGKPKVVAANIQRYVFAGGQKLAGLVKRRNYEAMLFATAPADIGKALLSALGLLVF